MTVKEARRIIDPDTSKEALTEIEYYAGFKGNEAVSTAAYIAKIIAMAALMKQESYLPKTGEDGYRYCTVCGKIVGDNANYCKHCGQLIVETEESPFEIAIVKALEDTFQQISTEPEANGRRENECCN